MCQQVKRINIWWEQLLMVQQRKQVSSMVTDWSGLMGWWCPLSDTQLSSKLYGSSFLSQNWCVCSVTLNVHNCLVCLVLSWRREGIQWQCLLLTVTVSHAISEGKCPSCLWWHKAAASPTVLRPWIWWREVMDMASCWDKKSWHAHNKKVRDTLMERLHPYGDKHILLRQSF